MNKEGVLFLVIGTGNKQDNHSAYTDVIIKAIIKAAAQTVVLIFSQNSISVNLVAEIKERCSSDYDIRQKQLPVSNMEYHADACYEWFDDLVKRYASKHIIVDITHGTKAMSAALYAVALHYNITDFQYVVKKADADGNFIDGAEIIEQFDASYARWQNILKQCRTLFASRQYGAVKDILSCEKPPKKLKGIIDRCGILSDFCSAWDRFDYNTAAKNVVEISIPELHYEYDAKIKETLEYLTKDISEYNDRKKDFEQNINISIYLMFDLYANGLRRLDNEQYEDAAIRAYRMAELLGQIHLMKAGYMSDFMPISDKNVSEFAAVSGWKTLKNSDYYKIGRKEVINFLHYMSYDSAVVKYLIDTEKKVEQRNTSVLIHGYSAKAKSKESLKSIFDGLIRQTKFFISEEDFNQRMKTSLFLNNNFKAGNNE